MFFSFPALSLLEYLIYIIAAVLPAYILLRYVYRHDTIEKEPTGLLLTLIGAGCIAALCAAVLESVAGYLLQLILSASSPVYTVLFAFLGIAAVEEGAKLLFLRLRTWNHPAFNYRFDGIVYSVFVSLGFAALENVQYVINYGLSVSLPRALMAIPGHMSFAVFMGIWYGRGRLMENLGDHPAANRCILKGYIFAVLLHGFYDACAMISSGVSSVVFLCFIIVMFYLAFSSLKHASATDAPITPYDEPEEGPFEL
ncbi:MAG: PrsW family intramembrane metalloprotease [Oscillospiraceae bacterium]|nr:PrsW family intramembrane metalloprotease [Oscillospiraceae bacterium]